MTFTPERAMYVEETKGNPADRKFRVARRINMVDPPGGAMLTKEQVDDYIADGVDVYVDPPWRSHRAGDRGEE